jgi:hypothetical protein
MIVESPLADLTWNGLTPSPLRCPFAAPGLDVSQCPGYRRAMVGTSDLRLGPSVQDWPTCEYLGAEPGRRGYYPACHHPGGLPLAAPDVARAVARRRTQRL